MEAPFQKPLEAPYHEPNNLKLLVYCSKTTTRIVVVLGTEECLCNNTVVC
jgi:hypothetical protein